MVPFTQTFKGKNRDKYLAQKLKSFQEQRAILAWLVEGAVRYYQEGLGDIPAIADATAAYQQRFDTIQGFLKEGVEYGKSFACAGVEIYEAYKAFCAAKELEPENNTNFGMALVENGVEKVRTSDGMRYKGIKPKIM